MTPAPASLSEPATPLTRQLIADGCKPSTAYKSLRDLLDERDQAFRLLKHCLNRIERPNLSPDDLHVAESVRAFLARVEPKP